MKKVKLLKELDASQERNDQQYQQGIVNQAQLLLEQNATAERAVLSAMKLDKHIIAAEAAIEQKMIKGRLSEQFGRIYDEEQIKSICIKYDLRMLPTSYYKGSIDPLLGAKVREFLKNAGVEFNQFEAENFYIVAPTELFNYTKEDKPAPKPRIRRASSWWDDPILLYKPSNNRKEYAFVHQWGNDFSFIRRIRGFINATPTHNIACIATVLFTLCMSILFVLNIQTVIAVVSSVVVSMFFAGVFHNPFRSNARRFWNVGTIPHQFT